ncbi:MAG TPA: ATP-binding cassette domain-containing protein [Dehalococcoidales bacterium]|nr:ATP-binding cassette domain-containing protein [Dehalococcoidales bacterium]
MQNKKLSPSIPAIEATGLVKKFGTTRAVDNIDLSVKPGMVYGFLGPNGAGKTTAIRIFATLIRPDAGVARVYGYDVVREADKVRSLVGLTGQFASVDEDLTGFENIVLLARLRGFSWSQAKRRANDLFEFFELTYAADRQVKKYSGGMRRRIDIAASLVVTPDMLFLDEPTTGLDPRNRNQIWDIIRALVSDGITIFLTTQYLDEADQLADRIAVINNGKIIAEGSSGELKAMVGSGALHVRLNDPEKRPEALKILTEHLGVEVRLETDPVELSVRLAGPEIATGALLKLSQVGITVSNYSYGQPSLDEVFLALTDTSAKTTVKLETGR